MTNAASAESRTFENAEVLARNVAEWLCGLARASERHIRGEPGGRIDAASSL